MQYETFVVSVINVRLCTMVNDNIHLPSLLFFFSILEARIGIFSSVRSMYFLVMKNVGIDIFFLNEIQVRECQIIHVLCIEMDSICVYLFILRIKSILLLRIHSNVFLRIKSIILLRIHSNFLPRIKSIVLRIHSIRLRIHSNLLLRIPRLNDTVRIRPYMAVYRYFTDRITAVISGAEIRTVK
jgi:hypothetical protein